jgi:F-type H+-transporting ATPase subunit epsilon
MTLQLELVSADRLVWSGEAREVIARTAAGDIGVLTDHAPLLSLLVPGVVEIIPNDGDTLRVAVGDGFISVASNRVSILSEDVFLAAEVDEAAARADLAAADEGSVAAGFATAQLRAIGKD